MIVELRPTDVMREGRSPSQLIELKYQKTLEVFHRNGA